MDDEGKQMTITLDEFRERVGQELGVSEWHDISQERIDRFADATEDWQFIHTDPARAMRESEFGTTIAHGFLSLSLLSALAFEVLPTLRGQAMAMNYGFEKVRFLSPVPCGARVRGRFVLKDVSDLDQGRVRSRYDVNIEIEGRDRPALVADWIVMHVLGT